LNITNKTQFDNAEEVKMLSFAVTAYNEMTEPQQFGQRLLNSIAAARDHPAVNEIVIVNDGPAGIGEIADMLKGIPKVKFFGNEVRQGVFTNKIEAIARATGDWVINSDSDNFQDADYIDHVVGLSLDPDTWYCPSFAKPQFDYRRLVGRWDIETIPSGAFFDTPIAACAINTGNQVVNRAGYMKVFERFQGVRRFDLLLPNYLALTEKKRQSEDMHLAYGACDSILLNIEWLLAGGTLEFCEGLEYEHAVHIDKSGSNYDRAPAEKERLATILRGHLANGTIDER
jgi:glycosyltransferase involved in cell wall biosynthesis